MILNQPGNKQERQIGYQPRDHGSEPAAAIDLAIDCKCVVIRMPESEEGEDASQGGAAALGLALGASSEGGSKAEVGTVYQATLNNVKIQIELFPGPCQDTMADIEYETTVTIHLGPETYRGCGNALH